MRFDDHFLSWVLIYAILVCVSEFLLSLFNKFRLNKWFIIWVFTNSLSYWLIGLFLGLFTIQIQFLYYLLFGLVFHLLTWFIKHKIYGKFTNK